MLSSVIVVSLSHTVVATYVQSVQGITARILKGRQFWMSLDDSVDFLSPAPLFEKPSILDLTPQVIAKDWGQSRRRPPPRWRQKPPA